MRKLLFIFFLPRDGKYGKLYFAVLVNGRGSIGKFNRPALLKLTSTSHKHTLLFTIFLSPCLRLRNNDDDDQDTAEAGPDVEALGEVEVVLAGEAGGKVHRTHSLALHHLLYQK